MDPDPDLVQRISQVFSETSNIDPHTSRLRTQTRFFTPLSCDLEPIITMPNPKKIVVSTDLAPDMPADLNSGRVIARVFHETFLLNISCHDFEKVDEGRKISIQLWLYMAGDQNYILSRYIFSLSFVSLKEYARIKPNNLIWLHMTREFMSVYFHGCNYFANVSFID